MNLKHLSVETIQNTDVLLCVCNSATMSEQASTRHLSFHDSFLIKGHTSTSDCPACFPESIQETSFLPKFRVSMQATGKNLSSTNVLWTVEDFFCSGYNQKRSIQRFDFQALLREHRTTSSDAHSLIKNCSFERKIWSASIET